MTAANFYRAGTDLFCVDLGRLVDTYDAKGLEAASAECAAIAERRSLTASERLALADAFRRRIILGA